MHMVAEGDQTFKGLIEHLCNVFQSGDTLSKLAISMVMPKNTRETEDTLAHDLKTFTRKIIVCKPSSNLEANQQLKAE